MVGVGGGSDKIFLMIIELSLFYKTANSKDPDTLSLALANTFWCKLPNTFSWVLYLSQIRILPQSEGSGYIGFHILAVLPAALCTSEALSTGYQGIRGSVISHSLAPRAVTHRELPESFLP